MKEELQ